MGVDVNQVHDLEDVVDGSFQVLAKEQILHGELENGHVHDELDGVLDEVLSGELDVELGGVMNEVMNGILSGVLDGLDGVLSCVLDDV